MAWPEGALVDKRGRPRCTSIQNPKRVRISISAVIRYADSSRCPQELECIPDAIYCTSEDGTLLLVAEGCSLSPCISSVGAGASDCSTGKG